jgi:hypothetical protein
MKASIINNAAAGSFTAAAGSAGKTLKIFGWNLTAAAPLTFKFIDSVGPTDLTGQISMVVGVPNVQPIGPEPVFTLGQGVASASLNINQVGAVQLSGSIFYELFPQ